MVFEENREFSADLHGLVQPLSESYVAVTLDYWQIFWGPGSTKPGRFLRKYGFTGIDTAGQVVLSPAGELIESGRSWKTGRGFTPQELRGYAARYPADAAKKDALRLSWFLIDPAYYRIDLGGDPKGYCSAVGAATGARKMRRPLVRVDGAALALLENDQEFLRRHLRQFWWQKGSPDGPARLVVLNAHDTPAGGEPSELTGACPAGKVPTVMATVDLSGGVRPDEVSPVLDECWRRYMSARPSNADNLTFAKDNVERFKALDATVRRLARDGNLLAPGGRPLFPRRK